MPEEIEVPTEHLHEKMSEEAEEAKEGRRWISRVAVSSALLAVAAAISALMAGHHANEAMLEEMKATDKWALYQAKGIKSALLQSKIDVLEASGKQVAPAVKADVKRYDDEQGDIKQDGLELEASSDDHMKHHESFAYAVTIFQIAIALGAIAVLARKPKLWWLSLGGGLAGLVFLILGII
ncbi:MAG TPA: DUF4337 domain-containing protein [Kofleriaceae bacterium]|nr:DUF4337 domain-containing protein [Kofleriaceae bacterium]